MVVPDRFLQQGRPDALRQPAVDLPVHHHWVDYHAEIVDRIKPGQPHRPVVRVYPHHRNVGAVGKGIAVGFPIDAGRQPALDPLRHRLGAGGQGGHLPPSYAAVGDILGVEPAAAQFDVLRVGAEQGGGQ